MCCPSGVDRGVMCSVGVCAWWSSHTVYVCAVGLRVGRRVVCVCAGEQACVRGRCMWSRFVYVHVHTCHMHSVVTHVGKRI